MRSLMVRWSRRLLGLVAILLLAAALGWWQRETVLAWHAVRQLTRANDDNRAACIARVAAHETRALPFLLRGMQSPDARACDNIHKCLLELARHWPAEDARRLQLVQELAHGFGAMSVEGRRAALELDLALSPSVPAPFAPAISAMVSQAAATQDVEIHDRALKLAVHLVRENAPAGALMACRELAQVCLKDSAPENRVRALRLAIQPNIDLRDQVVPLLHDKAAEIRRAAMIVLGPVDDVIATDDLLQWLHDPDAEVRRLCEVALRGRGLQDEHLRMGRLLTDSRTTERLKVLDALRNALRRNADLEPGVWLRRLSHDPAPAVRAATARMAAELSFVDLSDRLEQMCEDDPSPTIRQLARYYLSCRKPE